MGSVTTGHLHSFKVALPQILIDYNKEERNFTVEKPGRHRLNQMTISKRTNCEQKLPDRLQ